MWTRTTMKLVKLGTEHVNAVEVHDCVPIRVSYTASTFATYQLD